ncbi:LpxL/LpxP family acyltransferase [Kaarinaea lacus]
MASNFNNKVLLTMDTTNQSQNVRSEVLRSPSLYLKEFEASEALNIHQRRLLSGTRMKAVLAPLMYWAIKYVPKWLALLPIRVIVALLRLLYIWSDNPFRQSCEYICRLARVAGHNHQPKQIYSQLLTNALGTVENYFHLYRDGMDSVIDNIQLDAQDAERINRLGKEYGGVMIMVPHNFASVFAAVKMNRAFQLLIVTRNSPTIDRTKAALDFFERMQVTVLMVRGGNPFELSRTLFAELKKGTVIAATVDSIDHSSQTMVRMFAQELGFASWAAKIGVKKKVPIIPSYFRSNGRHVVAVFGEEIVTDDLPTAMQHYAGFFESQILEDPASWAYLGDKRWRKLLHKASQ